MKTRNRLSGALAKEEMHGFAFFGIHLDEWQYEALSKLAKEFPFIDERGKPVANKECLLFDLLAVLGLAQIDVLSPLLRTMIRYCEAEGLDQRMYLRSLVQMKFRKRLHQRGR